MMDSSSNVYGDYGENFLEDFMNSSSNGNPVASTADSQFTGGVDILQQSLKAADILDNNSNASFDDFGLMFNNESYNNNTASNVDSFQPNSLASTSLYFAEQSSAQTSAVSSTFNADDFLNIPTTSSLGVGSSEKKTLQENNSTRDFNASTSNIWVSHVQPQAVSSSNSPKLLPTKTTFPLLNQANSTQSVFTAQTSALSVPLGQIQLQIPANASSTLTRQGRTNDAVHSYQNTQYVVSGNQSISQFSTSSYATCTSTTLQSNSVSVCGTTFTRVIQQPVSVPVIIQPSQTVISSGSMLEPTQQYATSVVENSQSIASREEQTNKIALILRTKAAQQSGGGNASILRVGDQRIDISDPSVVKALATKIYEQRLKQQSQNQHSTTHPMLAQSNTSSLVQNRGSLNISGVQNKVILTTPQQQPQVKTQYVYSVPQNVIQNNFIQIDRSRNVLPVNSASSVSGSDKTGSLIHLSSSKPNNSVPLNRIQIASVNVPLSSNQQNSGNGSTHRSGLPLQIISNQTASLPVSQASVQILRTVVPSSTASNLMSQSVGSGLKPNPTQQTNSFTKEQIQKIQIQHQAALQARKSASPVVINQFRSSVNGPSTSPATHQPATAATSQAKATSTTKVVVFRVDPNLTLQQVEHVQQLILKKAIPPNSTPLTVEQKQLLSAFRAQLRTMDHPIQQYYLRNPQLFLHKVYQHLQTGRPYMFQAKVEQVAATKTLTSAASMATTQHPTISLTQGGNQQGKVQMVKVNRVASPSVANQPRKATKRPVKESPPKPASAQPQPPKRPSLIMEQLYKHREMVEHPDTNSPFITVRDAFRKLLPYHVYNTPQIEEESFTESEPIFDGISNSLISKQIKMLNKYHMLCLKETTKEVCSADVVMLERSYLQHERSMFAELKKQIKDDPNSIKSYIPPTYADDHPELTTYFQEQSRQNEKAVKAKNLLLTNPRKISCQSIDSLSRGSPVPSGTNRNNYLTMQDSESVGCEELPIEAHDESLLQEAVDSILS